jgi:hypothetical protein
LRHGGLARAYLCDRVLQKARGDACYTGAVELEIRNVGRASAGRVMQQRGGGGGEAARRTTAEAQEQQPAGALWSGGRSR